MKKLFYIGLILACLVLVSFYLNYALGIICLCLSMVLMIIGIRDVLQKSHTIRRNYPIIGNLRYLLEEIRPEVNQYFIESNTDGKLKKLKILEVY